RRLSALTATQGHLLDGRVNYAQPATGFRSGIEPVLLAAAVPAQRQEGVLEGGSGAGAALLGLAGPVPELRGVGVERDPALATLAAENAQANHQAGVRFICADVAMLPELGQFDHAIANPPYHASAGTASPDLGRESAKRGQPGLIATWATALGR